MRIVDRCHIININDFVDLLDPPILSLLEVIWDVMSLALPEYDL